VRYYLVREAPLGNDISFSIPHITQRYNSELADGLGNLVYRVLSMLEKYCSGAIPSIAPDEKMIQNIHSLAEKAYASYLQHDIHESLIQSWEIVNAGNKYISDKAPWNLMKEGKRSEAEQLLVTEVEICRVLSILIAPVLPLSAEKICSQFGFQKPLFANLKSIPSMGGKNVMKGSVLFAKREVN
jgi:methionyl-tRNA synthetase